SSLNWAIGVLGVSIVLELLSFRTAIHEANTVRGDAGWWQFIRHSKTPELPVVLLEDLGALLGLVFALGGVTLASVTHEPRFDALGSLVIGVLLCTIAYFLATELRSLLIGESASAKDLAAIEKALRAEANVEELIHFRTQHIGPDELLVAAKVKLKAELSGIQVVESINRIEQQVRAEIPAAKMIYIEPDIEGTRLWT
ncbi:MAG: cation transporter, partial [Actinomycetota bacterium]